jgi:pyridoxal phosphate enzyme (YggS family)
MHELGDSLPWSHWTGEAAMPIDLKSTRIDGEFGTPSSPEGLITIEVESKLRAVLKSISSAAREAGRDPASIRLVAVTKTFPAERILAAYHSGARDIGENRIEEARDKVAAVNAQTSARDPIRWHLIGHLQRRKAREAAQLFDLIQSVDSVKLADTLNRHSHALDRRLPILLQVNVARDPRKFGFMPEPHDLFLNAVAMILEMASLSVQGLMTIGPPVSEPEGARPTFRALRELRDKLARRFPSAEWTELSMGMTDDFAVAIAEGATIVRIGRAIFGERS